MSHPFGNLVRQHLSRKHGLSQNKLANGIDQDPAVISGMCHGKRLHGSLARERVLAIIDWFNTQGVLHDLNEANRLLEAAQMSSLSSSKPIEKQLLEQLKTSQPTLMRQTTEETVQATAVLDQPQSFSFQDTKPNFIFVRRRLLGILLVIVVVFSIFYFVSEGRSGLIWQVDFYDFDPSKWQEPSAIWSVEEQKSATLSENDPELFYGKVESEQITVNTAMAPVLSIHATAVDPNASYSIQIQDATTFEPIDVLKDITLPGEHTIDLVNAMGWQTNEKYIITINIWISGEGKSVTFDQLEISSG
ncbi:hypothetical protein [Candidatus Leptofilum sp.]|uniref:hypothetical protein n=1 Tax=Candidatus Leptofilum sp. TaxID=3241576 RepID=UPI003B5C7273